MGRPKGGKNKKWTKEEKLKLVLKNVNEHIGQPTLAKEYGVSRSQINYWVNSYLEYGEDGLINKRKSGNKFAALHTSKNLTENERLQLIVMQQEIEIERLKKGYFVKGVGAKKEYVSIKEKNLK